MERFKLPSMYELCLMHTRSDRVVRNVVAKKLSSHGLTLMEWLALGAVSAGPKTGLSMTEIARTLNVTLPQVTALITDLLERRFIKQKILSSDHRGRQVTVTLKGKRILNKLETTIARDMRELTNSVPNNRMREYVRTVQKLSEQAD